MANGEPVAPATPLTAQAPLTNAKGQRICGADRGRGRGLCQSVILFPNGRCKTHNGRAASGPDNPAWKHGRHSKWLPKNLIEEAARAIEDPHFRRIDMDLALLDHFMGETAREAVRARKPEKKQAARDKFAELVVKRSKVLTEESRRIANESDSMSRAQIAMILTLYCTAVRDVLLTHPDGMKIMADIRSKWRQVTGPLRTRGVTPPAATERSNDGDQSSRGRDDQTLEGSIVHVRAAEGV